MNYKSTQTATTSGEPRSSENAGRTLALERHGIAHVPTSRRYGRPRNQFTVRFAPVIYLAGIYLGASGGPLGLGFTGSVTAIVLANVLGSIITGLCAVMGPRLGMPQLPMGRAPFGYYGNFLPAILSLLIFIGYYSVGTVLGAKSLADLLHAPYIPTVVVVAVLSILIGIFGYRILHAMGKLITNVSIVVLTVVSIVLILHGGGPGTEATASGSDYWLAWFVLFTAVFGYTASWAPYASDYSRYLPEDSKPSSIFTAATLGLFSSTTWMMCLGAGLITLAPDGDVLDTFSLALPDWLRYVVLLTLGLSAIPHNSVNLYSGAMATLTCDVKLPQWVTVTIAGVIGAGHCRGVRRRPVPGELPALPARRVVLHHALGCGPARRLFRGSTGRTQLPAGRELLHPDRGIRATEPRGSRGDDHRRHNLRALHGQRLLHRTDRLEPWWC